MSARVRLDFTSKQLELNGAVIGCFRPQSRTEGALELEGSLCSYLITPISYGQRITLYRSRRKVAEFESDFHEGINTLRIGEDLTFDLDNAGILYCPKGPAGTIVFTADDVNMQFNALVPAESLGLVAALAALDTMWANLVGFTRTKTQP